MVTALRSDGLGGWLPWSGAYVNSDGTYDVGSLIAGIYHLEFKPDWTDAHLPTKYHAEKSSVASGTDIVVGASMIISGIDADLTPGHISGKAMNGSGTGIPGVTVSAYEQVPYGWTKVRDAVTDASGNYDIGGLRTGTHRLMFETSPDYLGIAFGGGDSVWSELAVDVPATAGTTNSGNNIILSPAGHLAGQVTNDGSTGIKNFTVSLYRRDGEAVWECGTDTTAADGTYQFDGLVPGKYHVKVHDPLYRLTDEWYSDQVSMSTATSITVDAGSTSTADVEMTCGRIRGTVTAYNQPIEDVEVRVYRMNGETITWDSVGGNTDLTAADGTYDILGLPAPGVGETFHVLFLGGGYGSEYYLNDTNLAEANDVIVAQGETVGGIDGSFGGGSLEGTVSAGAGGLEGISVYAVHPDSHNAVAWDITDAAGKYSFPVLPVGTYHVWFADYLFSHRYLDEYSGDTTDVALASAVSVSNGYVTTYDNVMQEFGHITGRVTAPDGVSGVAGVVVTAQTPHPEGGYYTRQDDTDANGDYDIFGLEPADYKVRFTPPGASPYGSEWYSDASTMESATSIQVGMNTTVSGRDATLSEVGHVTGTVTDGTTGIPNITVGVYRPDGAGGWTYQGGVYTGADGTYTLNLPEGPYRLGFKDNDAWYEYNGGTFLEEFHPNAQTVGAASTVEVSNGVTTSVDASVSREARVCGTVLNMEGQPLAGISVGLRRAHGIDPSVYDTTSSDGSFEFSGLAANDYIVSFADLSGFYFTEYFDDYANGTGSTEIPVADGERVSGIDATLTAGGHITGTVTSDGGTPLTEVIAYAYKREPSGSFNYSGVSAVTAANGTYDLSRLQTGVYRVKFYDINQMRATEWNDDGIVIQFAGDINVTAGYTTPGIDATLGPAGAIEGTVTGQGGGPLAEDWVYALVPNGSGGWADAAAGCIIGQGAYRISGLRPGTYRVVFQDSSPYLGEYYDDVLDISEATSVTVVAGQDTHGISAELSYPSNIMGRVTSDGVNSISGICVRAEKPDGFGGWELVDWAYTIADGSYSITDVKPGVYRVSFDNNDTYVGEYYDDIHDAGEATPVTVLRGYDRTGIDAVLAPRSHITGRVSSNAGAPLAGANVSVYSRNQYGNWEYASSGTANAEGLYDVGGLLPGVYHVYFEDSEAVLAPEYFDDKPSQESATDVTVTVGVSTTGIDATLTPPASITGTVTAGESGLEGCFIRAYRSDGLGGWEVAVTTFSNASGGYAFTSVAAGDYLVEFAGVDQYLGEYYEDAADYSGATTVTVQSGQAATGVSAQLEIPGAIGGSVTASSGAPIGDVTVVAFKQNAAGWNQVASQTTTENGAYEFTGLRPGNYHVYFMAPEGYGSEYYNDAETWDSAAVVPVTSGGTSAGINAVLAERGSITGKVTSNGTDGIASVGVVAYTWDGDGWGYAMSTSTDESGTYTLGDLTAGTYRVGFSATNDYLGEYWNDSGSISAGADVAVENGQATPDIDAVLSPAAHITGTVTDGVSGLDSMSVVVYLSDGEGGWTWERNAYTAANGTYDIGGLKSGDYRVQFEGDAGHVGEYYDDAASYSSATTVTVAAGATVAGINAALSAPSHITGTVTSTEETAIAGIVVTAWSTTPTGGWEFRGMSYTGADGSYDISGLSAGSYYVMFQDDSYTYVYEYYQESDNSFGATPVVLVAGGTQSGINATLAKSGSIAGTVRSASSELLSGAAISLYEQNDSGQWVWCNFASTGADGQYLMAGVRPGVYRLNFDHDLYKPEYYIDASTVEAGTDVTVVEGGYTGGIDATLNTGATISGTVKSEQAEGIEGVGVYVYRLGQSGWEYASYAGTWADGTYNVTGLDAGTYRLWFYSNDDTHTSEWYADARWLEVATPIVLTEDEQRQDVDAVLARKGYVMGRVTSEEATGLADVYVAVNAQDQDGEWTEIANCYTDANGVYRTPGVPAGTVRISFADEAGVFATEFYSDQVTVATATDVTVTAGADTTGIDAVLGSAGHISGTVRSAEGLGLPDILVFTVGSDEDGNLTIETFNSTDADGGYDIAGLNSTTTRVLFYDMSGLFGFQFYDAASIMADASGVDVVAGQTTSGIDATLTAAGHITGTITVDGVPHGSTSAYIYTPNGLGGWSLLLGGTATTDSYGHYDIGGLAAGVYRLKFADNLGQEGECFVGGASDIASSQDITVTGGATVAGIDADYRAEAANGAPSAVSDETTATEDTDLVVSASEGVLANDSDVDSDTLEAQLASTTVNGTLVLNADGSFFYRPKSDWNGTDQFTYRATDSETVSAIATCTIVVDPVNDAPVAQGDSGVTQENQPLSVLAPGVLSNDGDTESEKESLAAILVSGAAHGTVELQSDGSYIYTPAADYDGSDSFTYRVFDGEYSSTATVTITVENAPLIPTTATRTSVAAKSIAFAGSYIFTGTLSTSGTPVGARRVVLETSANGATYVASSLAVTTTPAGGFSFTVKPIAKTWYRVRFAADSKYLGAVTTAACVSVPAYVYTPVAPLTMYRTKYYTVYGFLKPRHTAGSGYPVRIYKYRYVSGRYVAAGYVYAKAADYSTFSKYYASVKLPYAGKWRLRAYAPADAGHLAAWSPGYDYVTVK